jgi:hypothetical protein
LLWGVLTAALGQSGWRQAHLSAVLAAIGRITLSADPLFAVAHTLLRQSGV